MAEQQSHVSVEHAPQRYGGASPSTSTSLPSTLARIEYCESGDTNEPTRLNSTASGYFQDLDSTWNNYDGYSRAMYAPESVQVEFNIAMYQRDGTSPWASSMSCWSK